jgi:hypothetical protein
LHKTFDLAFNILDIATGGVNVYDFTSYKDYPIALLESFFGSPDTKKQFALNPNITYGLQAANVYEGLFEDFMRR